MKDNNIFQKGSFETWIGVVEDREDNDELGRVKVRILGYHNEDKNELPTSDLPWCYPIQGITSAANSGVGSTPLGVVLGTWVVGFFLDNKDQQIPVFFGTFGSYQEKFVSDTTENDTSLIEDVADSAGPNLESGALVDSPTQNVREENIKSPNGWKLGQTSEKFESGGRGPGTINNYKMSNDPGGASYGSYQFASFLPKIRPDGRSRVDSRNTQLMQYINQSVFSEQFSGLTPGTEAFDARWKKVASENTEKFENDQYEFIKRNNFAVMSSKLQREGLDLTDCSAGVQDMIWSTAVQYGPNRLSVFLEPLKGKTQLTDKEIIETVMDFKIATIDRYFSSSPPTLQASIKNRFLSEKTALLSLSFGDVYATSTKEKETKYKEKYNATRDTTNRKKVANSLKGFNDPNGEYPREAYDYEQDTNKLARNIVKDTASELKSLFRASGMPLPSGNSFDQPSNPYAAKYPYNKVMESESGHVIEIDDTPGRERMNTWHRSGTFHEVDAEGNQVNRIVGSSYVITDRNGYIHVEGKANVSVSGSINVFVGADANIEVQGDTLIYCKNDIVAEAEGTIHVSAGEEISMRAPEIYIESENDMFIKSGGKLNIETKNEFNLLSGKDSLFYSFGNLQHQSVLDFNVDSKNIYLNSGKSKMAEYSKFSFAGLPIDGRYLVDEKIIADEFPPPRDEEDLYISESPNDSYTLEMAYEELRKSGKVGNAEINDIAAPVENTQPINNRPTEGTTSDADTEYTKTLSNVPDSYRLSQNFLLSDVSTKAAVSSNKVKAQFGLTEGEIIANLQNVAIYVLEPIKKKYPNMFVTSGFRPGSKGSQHTLGQAVDIQFKGAKKSDYFQIAKDLKNLIPFDQLLLEYSTYSNNPWIHISYKTNNNKGQVLTFFNNKVHSQGLTNLA